MWGKAGCKYLVVNPLQLMTASGPEPMNLTSCCVSSPWVLCQTSASSKNVFIYLFVFIYAFLMSSPSSTLISDLGTFAHYQKPLPSRQKQIEKISNNYVTVFNAQLCTVNDH